MKKVLYSLLFFSSLYYSQNKENYKLNFFGSLQADAGLDLGSILKPNRNNTNQTASYYDDQPTYFTYGFSAQAGYQPLNWLAFSSGLRYSYITPKFHNVYWMFQPYFFITRPEDKDLGYLTFDFGKQINKTQGSSNSSFVGIGVGKVDLIKENLAQKFQFNLDVQAIPEDPIWFLGFSYGIVIFSNKNL